MRLCKLLIALSVVAGLGCLAACGGFFVSASTLASIAVTPADPVILPNATQQFTATGTYGDGSTKDITSSVTWTSSLASVATVDSKGLATAVAVGGPTTITASTTASSSSSTKVTGTTGLSVNSKVVSSVTVTPASATLTRTLGQTTQQFSATATYSDNSTATSGFTWSSSNTAVATVNSSGLATAVATGTTNITASLGGKTSTAATLTVQ